LLHCNYFFFFFDFLKYSLITNSDRKLCTKKFETFDFLGDIVKDVPDVEVDKPERKSGAGR